MTSSCAAIIFPHQLFENNPALDKASFVFLVEAPRYFTDLSFHKKKLILHRASMKAYQTMLEKKKYSVIYISYHEYENLFIRLKKEKINELHYIDLVDIPFEKEFLKASKKITKNIVRHESPAFLSPVDWLKKTFKQKKYFMHSFYVKQRKRMKLLLTNTNKPVGGNWSYDDQNREPLSNTITIPSLWKPKENKFVQEAKQYVKKHFAKNPGSEKDFFYPIIHADAYTWLQDFFKKRFKDFGTYEDAILADQNFLFHSLLSPLLNNGLLTPDYVVEQTIAYAKKHKTPLNSLEGFIRQIIGWREFVRAVYIFEEKNQRKENFFSHKKKLPQSFWDATTGIEPIDTTIKKILDASYAHHIERLMILGNFMLLCGFNPTTVYTWFMEFFIDAYDWVMVPNVYGMSQYADGGLMTTKPYISGSNYICRMSNYKKNNWNAIWDSLYWHFLVINKKQLERIPRMRIVYTTLKKMDPKTIQKHLDNAQKFLKNL